MTGPFRARWLGASALPLLMVLAGQAIAQEAAEDAAPKFETVYVEARKRVEDQQTVPISLNAYSQDDLDQLGVKTIEDLRYSSPSLYIAPTTFRQDTLNITIRGQRNFDSPSGGGNSGLSFDTATAVYKDGVYYARAIGLGGSLFDVESVQVLKGPQGTLVGRNSTGGALLYQSKEPSGDYEAMVRTTLGDYGHAGLQGVINLPLSDTVSFRMALNADNEKGYISNHYYDPSSGMTNTQPAMGSNKLAALLSLKWQPSDDFKVLLRADLAAEHDTGSTYHDLGYFVGTVPSGSRASICNIPGTCPSTTNPASGFSYIDLLGHPVAPYYLTATASGVSNVNPSPLAYNASLNTLQRAQTEGFWSAEQAVSNLDVGHYQTYSATVDKSFDDIDVKWVTAYRTWDNTGQAISRGLAVEMNTYKFNTPNYRSWQSELTFNGSAFSDRVKWTGGLFYFNEFSPNDGGLLYLFLPAAGGAPSAVSGRQLTITDSRGNSEQNRSYAAYAQATWTVIDGTRLTAGMRYTYDERYAHIATQTIRTPSTQALATTQNGVFNPGALTFEGVSYTGTTTTCTLTSATGAILPLSQCAVDINRSYHKPTFTLALDHDLWDGTMLYGTMRSGYRSGAINTQGVNTAALVAAPEQVLDYEIGVKSDFAIMGTPVRTNLAAYQTVYHDIQVQQQVPNITTATAIGGGPCTQTALNAGQCLGTFNDNITLNAKSARIYGFEWEVEVLPTDWLTLSASGSYIDPRYTDYTFLVPPGYLQPSSNTNLSGTPIPVPAWQTNETVTFNLGHDPMGLPLGDASFTAHYYWQSRYLADMRNYDPSQRTFAYGLLNLRLEFKDFLRRNLDFALYANNVVGTQACLPEYTGVLNSAPNGTFGQPGTSGLLQCVPLAPRMVGAQLTYRF